MNGNILVSLWPMIHYLLNSVGVFSTQKGKLSQNHKLGQFGRDHSVSYCPTSPLNQGHPNAQDTGLCPDGSWMFPVRNTRQPLWTTCSSAQTFTPQKKISSCSGGTYCVSFYARCLLSYGLAQSRRAWLRSLDSHPLDIYTH